MDLVVDPPDDADVEDAAARARKIRMEVSLADTGALGSFSLPGLFDELEEDGGVKSPLQHWKEVRRPRPPSMNAPSRGDRDPTKTPSPRPRAPAGPT